MKAIKYGMGIQRFDDGWFVVMRFGPCVDESEAEDILEEVRPVVIDALTGPTGTH